MKKFFKIFGIVLIVIVGGIAIWIYTNLKDRHPGYKADLKITGNAPGKLKAGFAAVTITPEVPDTGKTKMAIINIIRIKETLLPMAMATGSLTRFGLQGSVTANLPAAFTTTPGPVPW
jgi:hypothetical protein